MAQALTFITEKCNITFIIPDEVEYECIVHPLNIHTQEYALSALRIKNALENGVLTKIKSDPQIIKKRDEILAFANNIFFMHGRALTLVQRGEAEMLALAYTLETKQLLMDERTTRLLIEAPFKIKEHFEVEFRTNVMVNTENLDKFNDIVKGMEVARSAELISVAYAHGFFTEYKKLAKEVYIATLYRLKYSGCSIRYDEIEELAKTA